MGEYTTTTDGIYIYYEYLGIGDEPKWISIRIDDYSVEYEWWDGYQSCIGRRDNAPARIQPDGGFYWIEHSITYQPRCKKL